MNVISQDSDTVTTTDSRDSPTPDILDSEDTDGSENDFVTRTKGSSWRPDASIVHNTVTRDKAPTDRNEFNSCNSDISGSKCTVTHYYQAPARASTPINQPGQQIKTHVRRLHRRSAVNADHNKAFVPIKGRNEITINTIQTRIQKGNEERVCRPYSMYSVPKTCDRFSIGPYGLPFESGATGRFRQRSLLSRSFPGLQSSDISLFRTNDHNSQLNEGLNLMVTELANGKGILRRPPDRPFRERQEVSTPSVHLVANERMTAVHDALARTTQQTKPSPAEYNVAVELVAHLQDERKETSCFKIPFCMSVKPDFEIPIDFTIEKQPVQMIHYMTKGELSLKEGKKANTFNPDVPKKPPTQFVKRPKREKSPPLSVVTKELFFPEVKSVRDEQKSKRIQERKGKIAKGLSSSNGKSKLIDEAVANNIVKECTSVVEKLDFHLDGISMDLVKSAETPSAEQQQYKECKPVELNQDMTDVQHSKTLKDNLLIDCEVANDTSNPHVLFSDRDDYSSPDKPVLRDNIEQVRETVTDKRLELGTGHDVANTKDKIIKTEVIGELETSIEAYSEVPVVVDNNINLQDNTVGESSVKSEESPNLETEEDEDGKYLKELEETKKDIDLKDRVGASSFELKEKDFKK